jgi:hypothetical protein
MTADDRYSEFFTEKLWELIPSLYRHEDGIAERPGTLRAFVELIAEQAALLRRSHDRLWDDAFIDLCDDWAVPYIGDLVATRMISAANLRGRRVDVAKTIYYRRRKGTPRVLEELIADITGWDGKVVESFRFLGRNFHRLDLPVAERVDPSPGWADLHSVRLAEQADSAWDPFAHTADVRKAHGKNGRWNIPRITFHLFRLAAIRLQGVTPHARAAAGTFTFDPSGRDTQLFMPRLRDDRYSWDQWESALPWQVPAPMGCRVLGHAEYILDDKLQAALLAAGVPAAAVDELTAVLGLRFPTEAALHGWLSTLANAATLLAPATYDTIRRLALIGECGKSALYPDAVAVHPVAGSTVPRERMAAGSLADWSLAPSDVDLVIDPKLGRFKLLTAPAVPADVRVDDVYGFGGKLGAGGYDRRTTIEDAPDVIVPPAGGTVDSATFPLTNALVDGVVEVADSATYAIVGTPPAIASLVVQAANFQRPYLQLAGDWVLTGAANAGATLVLEGLWIGATAPASLVIRGTWKEIVIRHCTLDPGGTDADGTALAPVTIWVEGAVDRLTVAASIAASIGVRASGELDDLVIEDSILDAQLAGGAALALTQTYVEARRTTVLGTLAADHLDASEILVTGLVDITDTQTGCFRFSVAPDGSRLPHPYHWVRWNGGPVFVSTRFGDPGYTWLADSAPDDIRRGGEHGVEIGAWSSQLNAIKEDGLLTKAEEYMPFGLLPLFIRET